MEKNYDIDNHLKRTLNRLEVQPDIRSFHEMMRKMHEKKKRRRFIIFFWFGLVLFGAFTFTLFNSIFNKNVSAKIVSKTEIPIAQTSKAYIKNTNIPASKTEISPGSNIIQQKINTPLTNTTIEKVGKPKNISTKNTLSKTNTNFIGLRKRDSIYAVKNIPTIKNTFTALKTKNKNERSVTDNDFVLLLPIKTQYLNIDTTQKELPLIMPDTSIQTSFLLQDSLKEKKKKICFYIGVNLEPKLSGYTYSKNTSRNNIYNDGSDFVDQYLKGKKAQSTFRFNYAFGLKAGLNIRKKYEVFVGFGFKNFKEVEEIYDYRTQTPAPTNPTGQSAFAYDMQALSKLKSNFNYYYYSVDAGRIYQLSKKIHYKAGLGLQANQLRSASFIFVTSPNIYSFSYYQYNPIQKWTYTASFKSGIMFDGGQRWQFQICPTAFYYPTSIFKKDYVIKQRPYGFSVECLILFKLF